MALCEATPVSRSREAAVIAELETQNDMIRTRCLGFVAERADLAAAVEQLRSENAVLKARVAELEAPDAPAVSS